MTVSVSQLECPRCGHRFELSETFRAHYEQEKQAAVADAVHHMSVKAEAEQAEREEAIRAEAQAQHEQQLADSAQRQESLQTQLRQQQAAQEELQEKFAKEQAEREEAIRAEAQAQHEQQLADSAQRQESLQAQLRQQQAVQEELQEKLAKEQAEREEREAEIRAEAATAAQARLAEATKLGEDLQAQLREIQAAQAANEARIREEAEAREQNLLTQLQQTQAEYAQQEALIREQAAEEAKQQAEERYALQREQDAIEKQRWERAAAEAQAKVADMQRQLGQGSVELQGEALEVYLKRQLQTQFPFDQIEDIGRGQLGADLTQAVFDGQLGACGIVVWEAKRTKHWNDDWLDKIKGDADRVGSQVRVIVSQALPPEIRVFALKEGVWVSSVEGALPLATALRAQLVESARLQRAGQGKGLKMDEIYNYLTSPRFGERIQRMVDTWQALEEQVASEERAMRRQWSERRKQLARMRETTTEMFTDFSAILGREIAQVPGLELEALPPAEEAGTTDPSSAWEDGGNF